MTLGFFSLYNLMMGSWDRGLWIVRFEWLLVQEYKEFG